VRLSASLLLRSRPKALAVLRSHPKAVTALSELDPLPKQRFDSPRVSRRDRSRSVPCCRRPKSLAARVPLPSTEVSCCGVRCRRPKSLAARYTLGGVAPSAATEVTACFATPRPTRPTEVVRIGAASPTRPTEVGHVEATDVRCTQPLLLPTRGSVGEGAVRSEDQQAHPRGPRPFHCRCSGRCAARDVLSRVFGAPMARSAPALLAHRSAPAGLAAPEGAALLDPKASLTRLSPSRPARPAPLATRR